MKRGAKMPERHAVSHSLLSHSAHPRSASLASNGLLSILERGKQYTERRSDGYLEPLHCAVLAASHYDSADDVLAVSHELQPNAIVVELCRSRSPVLESPSDASALPVPVSSEEFLRALRLAGGPTPLVLQYLASKLNGILGPNTGTSITPAAEARAAKDAADSLGIEVVLGDRPIEITVRRALDSMTTWQRLQLFGVLLSGAAVSLLKRQSENGDHEASLTESHEEWRNKHAVERFKEQLSQFGKLKEALIDERDLFLAWSGRRSKAVNGKSMILIVVGAAHFDGVVKHVQEEASSDLRLHEIADPGKEGKSGRRSPLSSLAISLVRDTAIGLAMYGAWQALR